MHLKTFLASLAFAGIISSAVAEQGVIEVVVTNVRADRGHVLAALCPQREFLKEHCPYNGSATARPGTVLVRIKGVPPGTYAYKLGTTRTTRGTSTATCSASLMRVSASHGIR